VRPLSTMISRTTIAGVSGQTTPLSVSFGKSGVGPGWGCLLRWELRPHDDDGKVSPHRRYPLGNPSLSEQGTIKEMEKEDVAA
jgi:hypothetical protein